MSTEPLLSQTELAERLGLSTRQVRNLEQQGLKAVSRKGKKGYVWTSAFAWYLEFKVQAAVAAVAPADFEEARARKMAAEAAIAELELAAKRRQLITQEDHARELTAWLEPIGAALRAMPGRYATQLAGLETPGEVQAVLETAVNETLETIQHLEPEEALPAA